MKKKNEKFLICSAILLFFFSIMKIIFLFIDWFWKKSLKANKHDNDETPKTTCLPINAKVLSEVLLPLKLLFYFIDVYFFF